MNKNNNTKTAAPKGFKREFQIFKKGSTTNGPIWILSVKGAFFDLSKKIAFYKSLGYTILNIQSKI